MKNPNLDFSNELNSNDTQQVVNLINQVKQEGQTERSDIATKKAVTDIVLILKEKYSVNGMLAQYLNIINNEGETILHSTMYGGPGGIFKRFWHSKFLLKEGINPNIQDSLGNTALHACIIDFKLCLDKKGYNNLDGIVKAYFGAIGCLIAGGADPTIKNNAQETSIELLKKVIENSPKDVRPALMKKDCTMQGFVNAYNAYIVYTEGLPLVRKMCLLSSQGPLYEQYKEPEGIENITRWADRVPAIKFDEPAASACLLY